MRALNEALRPATSTPDDVLFAVWEGWGSDPWESFPGRAQVPFTARACWLLRGPLEGAEVALDLTPWGGTLRPLAWWPSDRAWAAHCDVDWTCTCVAGTEQLIDAIVAHPGLEAVRISADEVY
jgi:hypothetical protein